MFHTYCFNSELQILMNVLKTLIGVILMQLAAILMEVTPAFATLDSGVVDGLAQVCIGLCISRRGWDRGKLSCVARVSLAKHLAKQRSGWVYTINSADMWIIYKTNLTCETTIVVECLYSLYTQLSTLYCFLEFV